MFAFFPWLRLHKDMYERPLEFDRFKLLKYHFGNLPGNVGLITQELLDQNFSHYFTKTNSNVSEATLVCMDNELELISQDPGSIIELYAFKNHLAFGGLAKREFFKQMSDDYNSANFDLHIQGFYNPKFGVISDRRRRDGRTRNFIADVTCPHHIECKSNIKLDTEAINTLQNIHDPKTQNIFEKAIQLFSYANTDSEAQLTNVELVLTVSAFEQLLQTRSNDREFAKGFIGKLRVSDSFKPEPLTSILKTQGQHNRYKSSSAVRDIWARDLYIWRNFFAHGNFPSDRTLLKNIRHLILEDYKHL